MVKANLDKEFTQAFVKWLYESEEKYKRGELKRAGPNGFTEKEIEYMFLIPYNKKLNKKCRECNKPKEKCAKC
jgi:hypothetical protein